ncbi:MAG: hypothetical protein J5693_00785 [Bacteroidales bacterium]|nr:hypothetical protein [Bacteroidales bacterium]
MKKTIIILTAIIALFAVSSCKKEPVNEHPLEGVWGFMSSETIVKNADGTILHQDKYDYNPFNPTNSADMKIVITSIGENNYSATSYSWGSDENNWRVQGPATKITIKDGNKFYAERVGGEMEEVGTISFSGDTFSIEGKRDILSIDGTPSGTRYMKEVYKRME